MTKIFISYSRVDKPFVEELIPLLQTVYGNDSVWYDKDIRGGTQWWPEILSQIALCDIFLYLLSNESVSSEYCNKEYQEAKRLNKFIIPVEIRDRITIPDDIAKLQIVKLTNINNVKAIIDLQAAIQYYDQISKQNKIEESKTQELKAQLIMQMGSAVYAVAIHAVEQLRQHKWIDDGSLQGKDFWKANLQGAELDGANLKDSSFPAANLRQVRLADCNMQNVWASATNFQEAKLWRSNLQQANLAESDFQGAELVGANLQGARLSLANLQGTNLNLVKYDSNIVLPDDTNWSPNTDMTRFTNPKHPHFWRPKPGGVWWYPK
ncbi:pentapeptide repeat-containing protein [Chloroflexota bacterium]